VDRLNKSKSLIENFFNTVFSVYDNFNIPIDQYLY